MNRSGYNYKLSYKPSPPSSTNSKKNRHRNITWYNPPYSSNVATNIGRQFLKIISRSFPASHILHKIFNRNTVKVSYSCMNNLKSHIDSHNKNMLSNPQQTIITRNCNCRTKNLCPLEGMCLTAGIVYQATVSTETSNETYVGLTENTFKSRYTNHKASFNHYNKKNATELSKHIWNLKESSTPYNINWTILKRASPYNINTGRCNLCLWEKYFIVYKPFLSSLNKRNELFSSCRHAGKYLLKNFNSKYSSFF